MKGENTIKISSNYYLLHKREALHWLPRNLGASTSEGCVPWEARDPEVWPSDHALWEGVCVRRQLHPTFTDSQFPAQSQQLLTFRMSTS